ncbi:MAG: bifunctional precorrin-2 dehydrogenase/sirohydrochlorin ferrochelatase [Nitrospirae bacterium]|nr:bifunctional precorrin-2 dehydrogenase/sirohydrochlorin ferrochelatase [Nitrospirota bacterium]
MRKPFYYPVFLNLEGKKCVVIGGGKVAERKVLSLLKAGAEVTVISPECTKNLSRKAISGDIKCIDRKYKQGDLKNAFLVVAATDDNEINEKVFEESAHLINVVDMPLLCNFIVPSVVRRGPLTIAISTSGISPSLAKTIRKELERLYVPGFAKSLNKLRQVRREAIAEIRDKTDRERFLKKQAENILKKLRRV